MRPKFEFQYTMLQSIVSDGIEYYRIIDLYQNATPIRGSSDAISSNPTRIPSPKFRFPYNRKPFRCCI